METINARICKIRKSLKYSQAIFADYIGVKRVTISWLEKDGNTVTEQNKQIICDKFGVSRRWLETGDGEMYEPKSQDSVFKSLRERYGMNETEEKILQAYFEIDEAHRHVITDFIKSLADKIAPCHKSCEEERLARIEEERRQINKELDDEKRGVISSASTNAGEGKRA